MKKIVYILAFAPYGLIAQEKFFSSIDTIRTNDSMKITTEIWCRDLKNNYGSNLINFRRLYVKNILVAEYAIEDFDAKNGSVITYHLNGRIKEYYNCEKGNRIGKYVEFYENGKIKTSGEYALIPNLPKYNIKDDSTYIKETGSTFVVSRIVFFDYKIGQRNYWSENDSIIKVEVWNDGKLKSSKTE